MNRVFVTAAILAAFFIGCIGGWRVTMRHAEIRWMDTNIAVISTWGHEDIYILEAVG